ncbi:tRNA (adenosine(37)-N6)-threonylcarbamoyltransferase complex ATPase subunit type 1 TsaE [Bergeyella cardium]|uniref:tRNA threonylcarbamoyladenosine biosynthesis protein TsaE n=1 Tax=Bergeyella cardium TaxID=1585976 RepID=A0A6P1QZB8_9FLAO|nr:tRNA (adenosine(37)-N6)-threonylcarbamoyltransferase complex ATPase subunit type 1 TsaE [Bergeyella cardium]QHN66044.1 tRNA (adenosine(37)-N6)-threonylcarbamoyltransferase complex ATPase subunit type 1 TsaE [Bergeyella cardium]WHE33651.1 tRNA (adenosine(37)-N6)-threonylcarbamoyltransferase complex ATPase subunit type 1 TsaE [Bergeyella cardium]WHF60301.1 tRNA (adenosine(37)-N6)-threonylcarbamoyltransferase complex ATPase subunit type 1 TsaE [Bergeyella cardium]
MEFKIHRLEEWNEVIDALLPHIKHNILLMRGNLGAGKTTFTQFLLKKLGSADEVSSPTYAIVNEYHSPRGRVNHFDLYRMKSIEEVYDIGIEEYLDNAFLNIIEWAEIYEPALEGIPYHSLSIEVEEGVRRVVFE